MRSVEFHSSGCFPEALRWLEESGAVYVEGLGDDQNLLSFAEQFGELVPPVVDMPANELDPRIYEVGVRNEGAGVRDRQGNVPISTTNQEFPLHTDGFNRSMPPRYVFLLRIDDGDDATPTYVSDAASALENLPADARERVRETVLSSAGDQPVIRFNRQKMDDTPAGDALDQLSEALRDRREAVVIQPGDCLVVANWRVCHGRSEMPPASSRILHRVWVA
jgi:alpha-ketoglutarate-dependent taurine dioxygenase